MKKNYFKKLLILALAICAGQLHAQTQKIITDYGTKKTFEKDATITTESANTGADVVNPNKYGTLNIVAGSGANASTDNVDPLLAGFRNILNLEFDDNGNMFITENTSPGKIRAIKASNNEVITIKSGVSTEFAFAGIYGISIHNQKIYVVSGASNTIKYADILTDISTPFTFITATLPAGISSSIRSLAIDSTSAANEPIFYILDNQTSIKRVQLNLLTNVVTTLTDIIIPEPTPALNNANQIRVMANRDIYVANRNNSVILKYIYNNINDSYTISTLAGIVNADRPASHNFIYNSPYLNRPIDVAVGELNKVYFSEYNGTRIRVYDPNSPDKVLTVIGQNGGSVTVDNSVGYEARGDGHFGIRIKDGYLYFTQTVGRKITKVDISSGKFPYTISPALPEGLVFNNYNGQITGTPTSLSALATYTVTTYNNSGASEGTANIEIEVVLSTMPVTLNSFEAKKQSDGTVNITWSTASETNNDKFIVYKSTDGVNYTALITKSSSGNQGGNYSFVDTKVAAGTNYYKLTQVDFDGTSKELGIKAVEGSFTAQTWTIYPNPIKGGQVYIKYNGKALTEKTVKIHDITGRLIYNQQHVLNSETPITFDQPLSKGIYTITVESLGVQKIIVQ